MIKPTKLLLLAIILGGKANAQSSDQHYTLKFQAFTPASRPQTESLLYQLTGANAVTFEPRDSSFSLSTPRVLNKPVIEGKLRKHYLVLQSFVHREVPPEPFPVMQHRGDADADALRYEAEKQAWIRKYPEAYQRLVSKP